MKIVSESDVFIQGVPVLARTVVEVEDAFANKLIADKIVRAATDDEIAAAGQIAADLITATTYDKAEAPAAPAEVVPPAEENAKP